MSPIRLASLLRARSVKAAFAAAPNGRNITLPFNNKESRCPGFYRVVIIAFIVQAVEAVSAIRDDLVLHPDQNRSAPSLSQNGRPLQITRIGT
jgi:hypothetical protein